MYYVILLYFITALIYLFVLQYKRILYSPETAPLEWLFNSNGIRYFQSAPRLLIQQSSGSSTKPLMLKHRRLLVHTLRLEFMDETQRPAIYWMLRVHESITPENPTEYFCEKQKEYQNISFERHASVLNIVCNIKKIVQLLKILFTSIVKQNCIKKIIPIGKTLYDLSDSYNTSELQCFFRSCQSYFTDWVVLCEIGHVCVT